MCIFSEECILAYFYSIKFHIQHSFKKKKVKKQKDELCFLSFLTAEDTKLPEKQQATELWS